MSNVLYVTNETLTADFAEYTCKLENGGSFSGLVGVEDGIAARNLIFSQGVKVVDATTEVVLRLKPFPGAVAKRYKVGEAIARVYHEL